MTEIKSTCRMCHGGCGVIVHVENGLVCNIEGDRENPNNRGYLCSKGLSSIQLIYHPQRIKYPLKRIGPKGSGKFKRISWSEAYSTISEKLINYKDNFGPESIVLSVGTDRNYQEWIFRFGNALGTPNILGPAHVCFYPRIMASIFTFGAFTFCDYENVPNCIIIWGSNKIISNSDGVIGRRLLNAIDKGSQLIVIDPRKTTLAKKAKYWLQIKPGTDLVLALGMINVIIEKNLYDKKFVKNHTTGLDELKMHVKEYNIDWVAQITRLKPELIRKAALFYANASSACIEIGNGIEENTNSFQCARAINILSGICGNIDKPGGDIIWKSMRIIGRKDFPLTHILPDDKIKKRLGSNQHRILGLSGWAHPYFVWKAILDKTPYLVKCILSFGNNMLLAYANSDLVFKALNDLEFLVVADLFKTPTAEMADIILPVSSWLERDQIVEFNSFLSVRQKIIQIDECKSDEEIILELAPRLNLDKYFWNTLEKALNFKLQPLGFSWEKFKTINYIPNRVEYYKYDKMGFETKNKKFNIFSKGLEHFGYEPLPRLKCSENRNNSSLPYVLTCRHSAYYFNSEFRNLSSLRKLEPDPIIEMHPDTASKKNIANGDWVAVLANGKQVYFKARLDTLISADVVCIPSSWWYPEFAFDKNWKRSNMNRITNNENSNPEMGSSNFRGINCDIEKVTSQKRKEDDIVF